MAKVVYTLKRKRNTNELHLFEASQSEDDKCTPKNKSICNKMSTDESSENIFACQSEDYARTSCANQGRKVCGICVSHLYETY
ncbi:MAG: hypothetical protein PHP53_11945 [Prolixibacteraceae bacterium]|nr:hypothetical protein [Prolixibacteraceae bacterium]